MNDYANDCDYVALKNGIKKILCRYFEADDDGNVNVDFDEYYTAQNAIDDIHDLIGEI